MPKTSTRTDIGAAEKVIWMAVETKATALISTPSKALLLLNEVERVAGKPERTRWETAIAGGKAPSLDTAHVLTVADAWLAYHI